MPGRRQFLASLPVVTVGVTAGCLGDSTEENSLPRRTVIPTPLWQYILRGLHVWVL